MPQGRRKVPFSGKAKKQQLLIKKQSKAEPSKGQSSSHGRKRTILIGSDSEDDDRDLQKVNYQPKGSKDVNRYVLQFYKESKAELNERKEIARQTLIKRDETELEVDIENFFPSDLTFPKRPPWDFNMTKEHLDAKENHYFTEYLKEIEKKFNWSEISYFELNLETWRQLWRVLELSDVVLIIVDIRFPAILFPPSLHKFIVETLKKEIVLVLNKIDLVPAPLVVAWTNYFKDNFSNIKIIKFTSFPSYNLRGNNENKTGLQIRRRKGKLKMAAEGAQKLLDACKEIVKDAVDLSTWQTKINEEMSLEYDDDEILIDQKVELKQQDTTYEVHEKYKEGILTIGCIGQPNVGKSSLMNALMGKKVVSVSRTPGHTKHFQTIFLTKNVRLCDCPGLVFPSKIPRTLQVLMGSYPIAQLREPFSTVQYLAERIDLIKILAIQHPENDEYWSAMDVCDGFAMKKGFRTARTGRLDSFRAANYLLRMALDGKIPFTLYPPNYIKSKAFWESHSEVEEVKWIQAYFSNKIVERNVNSENTDSDVEESDDDSVHKDSDNADDDNTEENEQTSQFQNKFGLLNSGD